MKTPPEKLAAARAWKKANRDRHLASVVAWQKQNRDRSNATKMRWKARNPDKVKLYSRRGPMALARHAARQRVRSKQMKPTPDVVAFYEQSASDVILPCEYCGTETTSKTRHVEHKTPLSRGGEHAIGNLAFACSRCNLRKGDLTAAEFVAGGAP